MQRDKVELRGGVVGVGRFGKVEIAAADVNALSNIEQLVARGASRLTAARILEIERGDDAPGRALPHTQARR